MNDDVEIRKRILVGPKLGNETQLKYGETIKFKGEALIVKFKYISEDSRCPEKVTCKWPGNAKAKLQVNGQEIALNTNILPNDTVISSYQISLSAVLPYPKYPDFIKPEEYVVRLIIEKLIIK